MTEAISFWADLSTVLLVLEAFVLFLAPGACLYFAVRGMRWLLARGRSFFKEAQRWTTRVEEGTANVSGRIAEPVIRVRVTWAWVRGVWRGLREGGLDG